MAWTETYSVGTEHVPAVGYGLQDEDARALAEPIQELLQDVKGAEDVRRSLEEVTRTAFRIDRLETVLSATGTVSEWRVGESLAEHHLASQHACVFPWPSGRDLKNPGTSGGGVDLIGFDTSGEKAALALGEVKTSRQQLWPPSALTGRHGLEKQLEGLRNNDDRKTWAVRYIAMHAVGKDWHGIYTEAMVRFLDDPEDVQLFGTLVHVADSNELDLKTRAKNLSDGCPPVTKIRLTAIYVSDQGLQIMAGEQVQWETPQ
ncbi:hypothetical protein ACIP4T_27085 [Streptomyces massasporeus]|uniref:hypothetical protein n=1 Tax=Streptomyces massasporeus TaxID=67324 RepID=UPI0036ECE722